MNQKLLIAFDDSENAQRAVEYVARNFSRDIRVTLFNVGLNSATLCNMESPELTPYFRSAQENFCILEDKKRDLVNQALERAVGVFKNAGFDAKQVTVKTESKKRSVAKDILAEAQKGYDLVVLGRRGASGMKDFLFGGTCQKVFGALKDVSILIVN